MALPNYSTPIDSLPSQMLTYREKVKSKKKWVRNCVDSLEQLGRRQYYDNLRFLENYQMLNGQFISHHYFEEEGYKDMITALTREFEMPSSLRHYDIIGKFVNNLTERLSDFPDIFRVEEIFEEDETNEYVRTQSDLMHKTVKANINQEIMMRLTEEGLDPNKQDFGSEQEAMQYRQEIQQMTTALTPPQIDKYMKTEWQSQAEIWGMHQLTVDKERFNMDELERKEFRDMLITDRCFRHFYFTGNGYQQETWNPLNTFIHVSPEIDWAQEGDYVGRITYMTKSDIINRFGWKMESDDIQALETLDREYSENLDMNGFPYKMYAPFEDFKAYDIIRKNTGYDPIERLPLMNEDLLYAITNNLPHVDRQAGLFRVTEVYWKSQAKRGKVVYIDPETHMLTEEWVDDSFVVPENFKEVKGEFYDGHEINTVYWTWVDEVWKAEKICFAVKDTDAIYLDMEPLEFQFKGDENPYNAKIPVCGRIFNNRNAMSMSFVDMLKPWQIGANVCYNQIYQLLEKEEGKFMIWDVKFFNNLKDWGGEDSFEKVKLIAKEFGHVFGDTSPTNMQGANPGNQLPKMVDMDLTAQMLSRVKLAQVFEQGAMGQYGIAAQFMAQPTSPGTAEGIKTAMDQTQLNVQKFYTEFFQYKKRCLAMNLDIAQYVQSHKKDFTINYTKSDQSRVFIQMLGTSLLMKDLSVFIVNSQQLMKQLETIKQVFVQNNTSGATPLDIVEVITSNSPSAIKAKLKESADKQEQKEQQQMQAQQQQFQAQQEADMEKENRVDQRGHENNETKIEVAQIMANKPPKSPTTTTQAPDNSLETNKFNAKVATDTRKNDLVAEQNEIQREKVTNQKLLEAKRIELQSKKLQAENKRTKAVVKTAKISNPKKKK